MSRDHQAHWFEPLARFLGPAYLRYAFTKGTEREVEALVELLALEPGQRVLDVGCGPGRHALALAALGIDVVGVDISAEFVALATEAAADEALDDRARFQVADARRLRFVEEFDAVISLCQGAFGLTAGPPFSPGPGGTGRGDTGPGGTGRGDTGPGGTGPAPVERELDEPILAGMARALRVGGRLAVSAFSAYFQLRYLEERDSFDADLGVNHETTTLRNADGDERAAELWTTCFTPRELRLLARGVGLTVEAVHSVTPGDYTAHRPTIETPEFLLLATRRR